MLLSREKPINFVELILDLRRPPYRWKLKAIAAALNVAPSTLGKWFYDSATPNFEDGKALVALHELITKKRQSGESQGNSVSQSASRAKALTEAQPREEQTMARSRPKQVQQPGDEPQAHAGAPGGDQSDPDAAIAAAQSGKARKISKPKPQVPPSPVKGDPERPKSAVVNAKRQMSYEEAMKLQSAGELRRSVLTEKGWVCANASEAAKRAAARVMPQ